MLRREKLTKFFTFKVYMLRSTFFFFFFIDFILDIRIHVNSFHVAHYSVDSTLRHSLRKLCVTIKKHTHNRCGDRVRSDNDKWKKCSGEKEGSERKSKYTLIYIGDWLLLKSCHRFESNNLTKRQHHCK